MRDPIQVLMLLKVGNHKYSLNLKLKLSNLEEVRGESVESKIPPKKERIG